MDKLQLEIVMRRRADYDVTAKHELVIRNLDARTERVLVEDVRVGQNVEYQVNEHTGEVRIKDEAGEWVTR